MTNNNNSFSEALIQIDWDFDVPPPTLRCPVTGQIIAAGYDPETGEFFDGFAEPNWEAIPTMLFHYIPEVGDFSYIKPELQEKIDEKRRALGDDAEDLGDFEVLEEHVESIGRAPLVFCLTTHGMGCGGGPLSSSIYVGLDLAAGCTNQSE